MYKLDLWAKYTLLMSASQYQYTHKFFLISSLETKMNISLLRRIYQILDFELKWAQKEYQMYMFTSLQYLPKKTHIYQKLDFKLQFANNECQ